MTLTQGLLDTNILILRAGIDPDELPDEMTISAITTAELSVGVLVAAGPQELAQRMKILRAAEAEFDPLPSRNRCPRVRPTLDRCHRLRPQPASPHSRFGDRLRLDRQPAAALHL
ncbi:hypothetical protein [Microbispora siamensis]|uniref:PIN domain-containing protein n=1 Tax=Microbispora siamensis TaxID=564413 RepID=A0ABQ4GUY2_9ACTN|nr:hypothetical protein [Microbispora siamensis]GIH65237.1 hypothetical protein Msi02_60540 [Microbispora siamensis]